MTSLRKLLNLLAAAGLVACLIIASVVLWDGRLVQQAVDRGMAAKDVVADILPPPMYLIELRLVLGMAADGSLGADEARKERDRLVAEYEARVSHWSQNPPYGLEKQLLGAQHQAGQAFIATSEAVLAAVKRGDEAAARDALAASHAAYLKHRAGVDTTVTAGNAFAQSAVSDIDASLRTLKWAAIVMMVLSVVTLGGLSHGCAAA